MHDLRAILNQRAYEGCLLRLIGQRSEEDA